MEHFVAGTTARTAAEFADINRNTVMKYFWTFREIIASNIEESYKFEGEMKFDESYFDGRRKDKVYTDTFKSYNPLDVSGFRHERINHSKLFADKRNHINWFAETVGRINEDVIQKYIQNQ